MNLRARLRRDEGGWVLVSSIVLMTIMLGVAMTTINWTDTQQKESGKVRTREAAFNLSESALTAQILTMTNKWPGKSGNVQFEPCTQASTGNMCPSAAAMSSLISSPDTAAGVQWRTEVRDNSDDSEFYNDAAAADNAKYDANNDGRVWVRAQATARGKTRAIVTLVKVEKYAEAFPHAAVLAGKLDISNSGNKVIIDGTGAATGTKVVGVRCKPKVGESTPCLGHAMSGGNVKNEADLQKMLDKQVSPNVTSTEEPNVKAIDDAAKERLKQTAIADGTYYATCPGSVPSGKVVYIESGNCFWTSNSTINSESSPGLLMINNGTLTIGGTFDFWGVIYAANVQNSTGNVVEIQGGATIHGGVIIDGLGGLIAGSNKLNIQLVEAAFYGIESYVSAGLIQNTWREIQPS